MVCQFPIGCDYSLLIKYGEEIDYVESCGKMFYAMGVFLKGLVKGYIHEFFWVVLLHTLKNMTPISRCIYVGVYVNTYIYIYMFL